MRRHPKHQVRALPSRAVRLCTHHALALLAVALLAGCGAGGPRAATPTPTPPTLPPPSLAALPRPSLEPSEPLALAEVTLRSPDGTAEVEVPVYVAADASTRGRGLMERDDLPHGTGMVFLFPGDTSGAFYMFNTRIPLSIAFYAGDGEVVRVLEMEPCTAEVATDCELYPPGVAYRGALEVEQDFAAEIGLAESWTVELPLYLPTPS